MKFNRNAALDQMSPSTNAQFAHGQRTALQRERRKDREKGKEKEEKTEENTHKAQRTHSHTFVKNQDQITKFTQKICIFYGPVYMVYILRNCAVKEEKTKTKFMKCKNTFASWIELCIECVRFRYSYVYTQTKMRSHMAVLAD